MRGHDALKGQDMKKRTPAQPVDKDQAAHDRMMAKMTPDEMTALAKGLGDLMRSKEKNDPTSSTRGSSKSSGEAVVGSFTDEDYEMAKALGFM